ncbi:MAG: hypothetical protein ACKVRN_02655 [Pyrinomonadaceae bacterium]
MNKSKNQNSILVLATIGVYLGLVLVGATPQVWAQAATSKQFNLKDESGAKEDLDKKPGESTSDLLTESIHVYLRDLDVYLNDVRKADEYLRSIYDPNEARIAGNYVGFYKLDPEPVVLAPCHQLGDANQPFKVAVSGVTRLPILLNPQYKNPSWSWSWDLGCKPLEAHPKEDIKFAVHVVSGSQKVHFTYQVVMNLSSAGEALNLFRNLERVFKLEAAFDLNSREKVLWENTRLTITDNTVFITTQLPRGSLDSLLASDAK